MAVLRVSSPRGEVVISGASDAEIEVLFAAFDRIGWSTEIRRSTDNIGRGWLNAPLRTNRKEEG